MSVGGYPQSADEDSAEVVGDPAVRPAEAGRTAGSDPESSSDGLWWGAGSCPYGISPSCEDRRMTTLVSWIAYDQRGPSSAYIATDSRISWGVGNVWDGARKCFASREYPDVFGYVGDVLLPSLVLGQFVDALDAGFVVGRDSGLPERQQALFESLSRSVESYPSAGQLQDFSVVHLGRLGEGMDSVFQASTVCCRDRTLKHEEQTSVDCSAVLELGSRGVREADAPTVDGSGKQSFGEQFASWSKSDHAHTSRAVFSSLCTSINSGAAPTVGGSPQLVGLYRIDGGKVFGVVTENGASVLGCSIDGRGRDDSVEFRNHLFARVDACGALLPGAKRHHPV